MANQFPLQVEYLYIALAIELSASEYYNSETKPRTSHVFVSNPSPPPDARLQRNYATGTYAKRSVKKYSLHHPSIRFYSIR